jgi:hypothetical protein
VNAWFRQSGVVWSRPRAGKADGRAALSEPTNHVKGEQAMADITDVLLKTYEENLEQIRQSEDQRAAIANIVVIISSVVLGYISQQAISRQILPLTFLLIILGSYGILITRKLYQVFVFHYEKTKWCYAKLDEIYPDLSLSELEEQLSKRTDQEFSFVSRFRLHQLWILMYLGILITGFVLAYLGIASP